MSYLPILKPWFNSIIIFSCFLLVFTLTHRLAQTAVRLLLSRFEAIGDLCLALTKPLRLFLFISGLYYALSVSPFAHLAETKLAQNILHSSIIFAFYWTLYNLATPSHDLLIKLLHYFGLKVNLSFSGILSSFLRAILFCLGFATIVSQWGYDINGFIAGLSLGGLAISMAAKDSLANIFSGMVILTDKPFSVGDWIVFNNIEGVVEKISFRSTRIRTFPQALVYVPNSLLTNASITNYTKRRKRRIDLKISITYDTPTAKIRHFNELLAASLLANPQLSPADQSVSLDSLSDSSLDINVICYTPQLALASYLKIREALNLEILDLLAQEGIQTAFPTTNVYLQRVAPPTQDEA